MRKASKINNQNTQIERVQRYHEGGTWGGEEYCFQGFECNKLYTSDRYIKLTDSFERPDGKPFKGFGTEIEIVCKGVSNQTVLAEVLKKIVFEQFPADLFKLQNDSSLGDGDDDETTAECITQIMTKEFIRNNYNAFKTMYNTYFPALGITASHASCGMHVNVSNACFGAKPETQTDTVRKLLYFINHNYNFCCDLFFRQKRHTQYCRQMVAYADKDTAKNADLTGFGCSHGVCLNLGHFNSGRVEIRLVGGQKNYACFRNTMESVFFLIDSLKRTSWNDLDDLGKVFRGCNQYVYDRLRSYCYEAGTISREALQAIQPTVERADYI